MTTNTTLAPPGPAPLSTGGRGPLRVLLVIAATTAIAIVLALLTAGAVGLSALRLVTDRQTLPTTMRSLTVDTADSPLAVRIVSDREATEPRVEIRTVASERGDRQILSVTNDANGTLLRVDLRAGFLPWGEPGEVTVTLPAELGSRLGVTVRQNAGLLISDADLDQLTATTTDGAIILRGTARRMEVRGQNGHIRSREPITVAESFSAALDNGDVEIRFAGTGPRRIDGATENGVVDISLPPPGPYLVRAHTDNGRARVQVPETSDPARAASEVTGRTENGEVAIVTDRSMGR